MDFNDLFCEKKMDGSGVAAGIGATLTNMRLDNITQEEVITFVMEKFLHNPIFSGGALLSLAGFLWYFIDWGWNIAQRIFRDRYFTSLQITNENMVYKWVIDHINVHSKWGTRNLSVISTLDENETGNSRFNHKFIPGTGSHYFYYKNRVVYFEKIRDKRDVNVKDEHGNQDSKRLETVTLSTYGGSPEFWHQFLDEASKECLIAMDKGVVIHTARSNYWEEYGEPRRKRNMDTVVLADGVSEKVYSDLKTFLASAQWYHDRGVPYRRGYLLYGPPGTGKSSFIAALASHFGYGISILSLTNRYLNDSDLQYLMNNTPNKTFIIMEDIDVAFKNRDKEEGEEDKNTVDANITLSGLLNAIDGIASSEERILFMTTNYKENLDAALIRPGRVDFQAYLGHCKPEMIQKMFRRFYEKNSEELIEKFVEATSKLDKSFSPAELQKHLIVYKDSPESAIENVNDLLQ